MQVRYIQILCFKSKYVILSIHSVNIKVHTQYCTIHILHILYFLS